MYSVVLMMAMTSTPDTVAFGHRHGCDGGGYMMGAPMGAPPPPAPGTAPAPRPGPGTMLAAPATIVVSLPADATLKVDGVATKATSDVRTFATPILPIGQSFHYTLTA